MGELIFGLNFREENTMTNRFLIRQVYKHAWQHSCDPSTKTGASIILTSEEDGNTVYTPIAFWANQLKPEILSKFSAEEIQEKLKDSYWKRDAMEHAETGAIKQAQNLGYETYGLTMVMPWIPCSGCAQAIVDSGIEKLITHDAFINKTPLDWEESTMKGVNTLLENNVDVVTYYGKIGSCYGQFRGDVWKP